MMSSGALDPVAYEIFVHRLWAIGEEGRFALQRVSASPIVVQGGECMSSFYDPDGNMTLAVSGHLRFAAATSDAIRYLIREFGESPGFHDGDQIFFNDPYIAGSHTYDQIVIKPIFYGGALVAWTASSSHTADVGGSLSGEPTEIFHEGIRILGLKVVEGGEFREDVFKTLTEQCRDPEYVGLDIKSRIAANNVCARGFTKLVDRFGADFIAAAGRRLIDDAELEARIKLRSIPDGVYRSRQYVTTRAARGRKARVLTINLAATKRGEELSLSFIGSSPEVDNDFNSTLPSTLAHVAVALTNFLFWNVPWSDGKMKPVSIEVEEGSVLNCRYPAACNRAPWVGQFVAAAVADCVAKMLLAAGARDEVNAGWFGYWYTGGPGYFYAGINQNGVPVAHGLYDIHGGGLGAAPDRDGVDSGGHMNIPSGGVSDVERIELQYPFLYFSRSHIVDGGGFGARRGGSGTQRIFMIRGSQNLTANFQPYGAIPQGAAGLCGGFGTGTGGDRAYYRAAPDLQRRLAGGDYPTSADQLQSGAWGLRQTPSGRSAKRVPLPEGTIVTDFTQSGGGYGDPLQREADDVLQDVRRGFLSTSAAALTYGVEVENDEITHTGTVSLRDRIRRNRLDHRAPDRVERKAPDGAPVLLGFHESLQVVAVGGEPWTQCKHCKELLGKATDNYKNSSRRIPMTLEDLAGGRVPSGDEYAGILDLYCCPGCAVLLQVDVRNGSGSSRPIHDAEFSSDWLAGLLGHHG